MKSAIGKSVPEIFIGKAMADWTVGDYWSLRFIIGGLGFIIWSAFAICLEILVRGRLFASNLSLLIFLGGMYAVVLVIAACWRMPIPIDLVTDYKEKISAEIKKVSLSLRRKKSKTSGTDSNDSFEDPRT